MKASLPVDEAQRLDILRGYNILDTPPEQAFDDLVMLAAQICQTPIALVSLVDETRQWFKSRIGISDTEMQRDIAFCAHAILKADEMLEVRDAERDPRFADNPLVTEEPHIRFYAGAPLATSAGPALGTLCVLDFNPRELTCEQRAALHALSRQVVSQMELRRQGCRLAEVAIERERAAILLQDQCNHLAAGKEEDERDLAKAEKLRLSLLSLVEDERRALRKLYLSEERFRELAETVNEVFWITDPAMQEVIYVSPAYERIWGQTCASLSAAPGQWLELVHPDDRKRIRKSLASLVARGSAETDYRLLRPDKTERWIHDKRFAVRNAEGEICRIVGVAEDVTEKRDLEEKFRQAQKMESIGQLASGIAHDFNNILAAVRGNIDLIIADAAGNRAVLESADEISRATQRACSLVKQILTFSRQGRLELGPVRLEAVVQEALKLLRTTLPSSIQILPEFSAPVTVLADPTAMHQVVMNLGTNAWHAMRGSPGALGVKIKPVELEGEFIKAHPGLAPGRYVRLSVSDTGVGMDRATQQRIFEPFFTTKSVGEGTGLGLAVVHGIVKSHGGAITVASELGKGTRFDVYLPLMEAEAPSKPEENLPACPGEREHILVVDDEVALADMERRRLERMGYRVTMKTSPTEAIATLRAQPETFDLVITDFGMPGMDGIKLGAELLRIQPRLAMILSTGYGGGITDENVGEFGFQALLLKPSTQAALAKVVHEVLHPPK